MGLNSPLSAGFALKRRFVLLSLAAGACFCILLARLWYLQVIRAENYTELSEQNRTRYIPVEPPRGSIFDRNGDLLVENRPAFSVTVIRQEVKEPEILLVRLNALLGVPYADLQRKYEQARRYPPYLPAPLVNDIGRDAMELLQEKSYELPGVMVKVVPVRTYTHDETGAHLFGYIGEVTESDLQNPRLSGYRPGDLIGKTGLEKHLEQHLRGTSGDRRIEVDARGRELRQLEGVAPIPGRKVYLTIDAGLQQVAEAAFGDQAGAAVAIDVETGEVLAMASRPTFDPSLFSGGISVKQWDELINNPQHPLQNRAIQGQYPPGSTFKLVSALAALRAGVATPETTVNCTGSITLGKNNQVIRCWNRSGHGYVNLHRALKESCDVWFYEVGLKLGIEKLAETAFAMGMGQTLDFPLDGEKKGLIPTKAWKKQRFGQGWFNGETAIAAIGQGYVLATPMQLATMTAVVANGGKVLRPHVVKRIEELDGRVVLEPKPEILQSLPLPPGMYASIRRGMEAVVHEPGGTAASCRLRGLRVAGKTGTAQVVKTREVKAANDPVALRDHALFVAFAPADKPKIAVAVIVEHGGHGGSAAAPVARAIFAKYFGLDEITPPLQVEPAAHAAPAVTVEEPESVPDLPELPELPDLPQPPPDEPDHAPTVPTED